jgi:integrase
MDVIRSVIREMSSVWRHPESRYWTACFRDTNGRQRRVSTKETDRKKALAIADQYEKSTRIKRTLRQTRKAIERLHEEIAGEPIPQKTLRAYALEWLAARKPETSPRTYYGYSGGVSQLLSYLRSRADAPISDLAKPELLAYRNHLAASLSSTTTNNHLALLRMLFKSARRDGVCLDNPAEFIGPVRASAKLDNKRPFTITELQAILAVADPEWRSLILFGLYTGQRLSDLVNLAWNNIDLERGEVRLMTLKTGRTMIIPMAPPLRSHIESLPASDDPRAPLHPRAFAILSRTGNASILSSAFSDLLVQAGLRAKPAPRDHRSRGIGHSGRRRINELSFHSLRRTATTLLHEAGVPPSVCQALIGHDSEEVHHDYIGIGREALRNAVNRFPSL